MNIIICDDRIDDRKNVSDLKVRAEFGAGMCGDG